MIQTRPSPISPTWLSTWDGIFPVWHLIKCSSSTHAFVMYIQMNYTILIFYYPLLMLSNKPLITLVQHSNYIWWSKAHSAAWRCLCFKGQEQIQGPRSILQLNTILRSQNVQCSSRCLTTQTCTHVMFSHLTSALIAPRTHLCCQVHRCEGWGGIRELTRSVYKQRPPSKWEKWGNNEWTHL